MFEEKNFYQLKKKVFLSSAIVICLSLNNTHWYFIFTNNVDYLDLLGYPHEVTTHSTPPTSHVTHHRTTTARTATTSTTTARTTSTTHASTTTIPMLNVCKYMIVQ